jgi:hypothetical protein
MAQANETKTGTGNKALPNEGDHDRVQMLSLKADGTPDQHNPELIGDEQSTLAATREQFKQQAVSAADVRERASVSAVTADEVGQDPRIAERQEAHRKVAEAAEAAADAAVKSLRRG